MLQLSSIDPPGSKRRLTFPYAFSTQEADKQKVRDTTSRLYL